MNEYFAELCEDPEYVKPNLLIIAADIEVARDNRNTSIWNSDS